MSKSEQFKKEYYKGDPEEYYWRTSGQFTYGVMKKREQNLIGKKSKRKK